MRKDSKMIKKLQISDPLLFYAIRLNLEIRTSYEMLWSQNLENPRIVKRSFRDPDQIIIANFSCDNRIHILSFLCQTNNHDRNYMIPQQAIHQDSRYDDLSCKKMSVASACIPFHRLFCCLYLCMYVIQHIRALAG